MNTDSSPTGDAPEELLEAVGTTERLGRIYAEALLDTAEKQGKVEAVAEEFDALVTQVLDHHPEIEAMLSGASSTRTQKAELITKAFAGKTEDIFLDFLQIVNRHGRLEFLRPIRAAYRKLCDERARRERVRVKSAVPLDDGQRDRLTELLRQRLGREPVLETEVVPELLGGLIVRIGDEVYDDTVRSRLVGLRDQLLARSNYAISNERDRFRSDG